jgi:polysaccharide pyruvyl transferase WcaK-like protein
LRVAHYGTFDVANYGDALFPLVLESRLPFADVTHVSPIGGSKYRDSAPSISVREADRRTFDAVVIGGGNIIHCDRGSLPDYRKTDRTAYASLWLGAADLAQRQGIPLVFNGPSVSLRSPDRTTRRLLDEVAERASYVALRDEASCRALSTRDCKVVPDTALEVSRLWSKHDLERAAAQYGLQSVATLAVHMKEKYSQAPLVVAEAIDVLARRFRATPVLIAIGQCHGDDQVHRRVAKLMKSEPICVVPNSLVGVASIIDHSVAYVGSSMHGFITAVALRTPGLLVLEQSPHHKFLGLLSSLGLDPADAIAADWTTASTLPVALVETEDRLAALRVLAGHWASVAEALQSEPRMDYSPTIRYWKSQVIARQLAASVRWRVRSAASRG